MAGQAWNMMLILSGGTSRKLQPLVVDVTTIDDGIIGVRIKYTSSFISFTAQYAPTEMRQVPGKDGFYENFNSSLNQCLHAHTLEHGGYSNTINDTSSAANSNV